MFSIFYKDTSAHGLEAKAQSIFSLVDNLLYHKKQVHY